MKKLGSFILKFITASAAVIIFGYLFFILFKHHKEGGWSSIFYVEYPAMLVGILVLLNICSNKLKLKNNISMMIMFFMSGITIVTLMAYIFVGSFVLEHTTVYSKLLYIVIICFVCYQAAIFFSKRNRVFISAVFIALAMLLVPGGIIINESFESKNIQQYTTIVTRKRRVDSSKSTSFYIYFEGKDGKIPMKKYNAEDIYEFNEYSEGDIVLMKKYRGVLGLPVIKLQKYSDTKLNS